MKHHIKEVAIEAFKAGALIGLVLLFVALMIRVATGGEPIIQANSPEDFFRPRSHDERMSELAELRLLGANQRFAVLHTIGGDAENTNAFAFGFADMVGQTVRDAEAIGMSFELALFENENGEDIPQTDRLALARAIASACRGSKTIINISEECTIPTADVLEMVDAIHEEWPDARVVIHNWPTQSFEDGLFTPLIGSKLFGVSGQIMFPGDAQRFVEEWSPHFPFVGIAEIQPGFRPDQSNYASLRPAVYASLMSSGFVGLYYWEHDQFAQSHQRWASAYQEVVIASQLSTIPDGQTYRPDLGAGSPAVASSRKDEVRAYMQSGVGTMALGSGEWIIRRINPATGAQYQAQRLTMVSPGLIPVSSGEAVVIARTTAREVVSGEDSAIEINGDGIADVADLIPRKVR